MAEKGLKIDQETFCCSICLDLLKDPVTIPCGHSYCMSCVNTHWNGEVGKKSYSCPQCRQDFTQRPVLVKNTMLAVLMEGLKKSGPPVAPVSHCYAEHGDVSCDLCSGRKLKAVKSCLQCLVSYCKDHLQPHYDVPALKKHKLVEPTENLQDNICSRHDEVMKMFCRTDQQCICYLCSVDEHKGHDTVTAAAERTEKQRELEDFQMKILQKIENKEKDVVNLQHQVKNISRSADTAVEHSDRSLQELIRLIEKRMTEVKLQVRSQQEAEERRVKELQDKLHQEITELKRKHTELDKLSHTEDHYQFLHKFASLAKVSEASESPNTSKTPPPFLDVVTAAVSELRNKLQETCALDPLAEVHVPKEQIHVTDQRPARSQVKILSQQDNISEEWPALPRANLKLKPTASSSQPFQPVPFPNVFNVQTTRDLKQYSRGLTFDPRSLNNKMELSDENTIVKRLPYSQTYRYHPARFTDFAQVVSKESLTGRCFWEVLGKYDAGFTVAVAYKDIRRDGPSNECCFGKNGKSWALECCHNQYVFWHNGCNIEIPIRSWSGIAVGVFLDYRVGILSFYQMGYELRHIHTVRATFTQPLVAGVRLDDVSSTAKFCSRRLY